jgi:hypothetical protein
MRTNPSLLDASPTAQRAIMRQRRCAFGLLAALISGLFAPAHAEVQVVGSLAAVRITTSQDAISDVLSALAATFNVRYRTAIPLDAAANGTYSGSFGRVIYSLLEGYNYVIKTDRESTEIVVFGRRGEVAIRPIPPRAPPVEYRRSDHVH